MVGHAQLPQGMAAKSQFDTLAVTAEFEMRYGVILRAAATLVTEEGRAFFSRILVGRSLNDGVDEIVQELRQLYHGAAQNALIAAAKDLGRQYATWKTQQRSGAQQTETAARK